MKKYQRWAVTAVSVLLALCITAVICPMVFYMNDDVTMRSILSGTYTGNPNGHAVYMKYPLTGLLSLLYRLAGGVPWFSLFMAGCFLLAVSMVIGVAAESVGGAGISKIRKIEMIVFMILVCGALFLPNFIYLHYTIVAAMLGGCGLFLVSMNAGPKAVVPFVLCYCVRSQVFFLLLPFLAVLLLCKLCEKRLKEQFLMLALLVGSILLCMVWDGGMYHSDEWRQFRAYNESRTQLYDYGDLLPYEEYADRYEAAGIGEQEYRILEHYALALDSTMDAETLQAAADIYEAKLLEERSLSEYLKYCLAEYYYHARYTDKPYNYILIAAYLLTAGLLLRRRKWLQMLPLCCMAAGRSLIWVYLIWQGRFPERVYISLYLLEIMALAGMSFALATAQAAVDVSGREQKGQDLDHLKKRRNVVNICVSAVFSLALFGTTLCQMKTVIQRASEQLTAQEKWTALTEYCQAHDENIYLLDVPSMVAYAGKVWESTPQGQSNYILAGGWMSASPLMQERILMLGAEDGGELLVRGEADGMGIFYIAKPERDMDWLSEYLGSRFGEVTVEKTDSIIQGGRELFCVYGVVPVSG